MIAYGQKVKRRGNCAAAVFFLSLRMFQIGTNSADQIWPESRKHADIMEFVTNKSCPGCPRFDAKHAEGNAEAVGVRRSVCREQGNRGVGVVLFTQLLQYLAHAG